MLGFRADLSSWQALVRAGSAALVSHGAATGMKQSKGSADLGHVAHPPAPGLLLCPQRVTGGLRWGFAQLRSEETSQFQITFTFF